MLPDENMNALHKMISADMYSEIELWPASPPKDFFQSTKELV